MTDDEVREIARTAAREAVREMMIAMGVDTSNPAAIIEMQKDFQSLRDWRQSMQAVRRHGLMTAIGVLTVGTLGMIYMHFMQR
jgi:hypothetical protein